MLLLEYQETTEELSHYEENAKSLATRLREVVDWLNSTSGEILGSKTEAERRHAKLSNKETSKPYEESMDFSKAEEAVQLVTQARQKLSNLRERKTALGLK